MKGYTHRFIPQNCPPDSHRRHGLFFEVAKSFEMWYPPLFLNQNPKLWSRATTKQSRHPSQVYN